MPPVRTSVITSQRASFVTLKPCEHHHAAALVIITQLPCRCCLLVNARCRFALATRHRRCLTFEFMDEVSPMVTLPSILNQPRVA